VVVIKFASWFLNRLVFDPGYGNDNVVPKRRIAYRLHGAISKMMETFML
jgi:hypothetical protein